MNASLCFAYLAGEWIGFGRIWNHSVCDTDVSDSLIYELRVLPTSEYWIRNIGLIRSSVYGRPENGPDSSSIEQNVYLCYWSLSP